MSYTYDFVAAPQLSQVRMLIADTDLTHPIYDDDEINNALYLESSQGLFVSGQGMPLGISSAATVPLVYSVYRSAALLLDALASNKSRLASINQLLDVKLSPEKSAQELRATAKQYRDTEANSGSFAIVEMVNDQFSARDRVWKQLLRLYGTS